MQSENENCHGKVAKWWGEGANFVFKVRELNENTKNEKKNLK